MTDRIKTQELFDLSHTLAWELLSGCVYPWEALGRISEAIMNIGDQLDTNIYAKTADDIWIARNALISPTAEITGPCIIGENTQIRPGAYIRGNVLIGNGAVIGNSTELKNCIIFDSAEVPHFNYVGDSILGYKAHMGAGSVTSNVKGNKTLVVVHGEIEYPTGLRKFGAMLGDMTEIGCNTVLNPGTIIGRNTQVYPLSSIRGVIPENSIVKTSGNIYQKR